MKKLIFFFAILFTVIANAQTVNLGIPNMAGLLVGIGGTYGFCEVYVQISTTKTTCNGGQPVFDNNCVSYVQDIDTSTWCKVAKITGASNVIPFNNPNSNGFGINLFADGKPHQLLFIFYVQAGVWQNTRFANFTAPSSSFVPPACPNKPPVAILWYYEGTGQMVAFPNNQRDNCPATVTISKNGTVITAANLVALCGAAASMQVNQTSTMLFNVTSGGTYIATVVNSAGSDASDPVNVVGSISSKGKRKN